MHRRIILLLVLAIVFGLFVYDRGYFFYSMLILIIGFVILQFLISLPGMFLAKVQISVQKPELRDEEPKFDLSAKSKFLFGAAKTHLIITNLFTGKSFLNKIKLYPPKNKTISINAFDAICGTLEMRIKRVFVVDLLGIFAIPKKIKTVNYITVMPPLYAANVNLPALLNAKLSDDTAETKKTPTQGAVAEYVDLREYRKGDSIRDFHWKLTAKKNKIIIKEKGYLSFEEPIICFDFFGDADDAGKVLGIIQAVSGELYLLERKHIIAWVNNNNTLETRNVFTTAELQQVICELLKTRLPQNAAPIKQFFADNANIIYVNKDGVIAF
jgi:hypothetical protein